MMSYHINHHLQKICGENPDILGCAIIDLEGVITASVLSRKIDEDLIGGMSSSMLGIGERISAELMDSDMEQVYVRSPNGYVILNAIGNQALLLVLVAKQAKLGLIFMEIHRTVQELEKAVEAENG